jgi:hypothetical protein
MRAATIIIGSFVAATAFGGAAQAQTPAPVPTTLRPAPVSNELSACKSTALIALQEKDASIKDIFFDEDGLSIASSNTKVEDTPIRHILMGEAYLETTRKDKPRRFLCLIGEKGKVLLTFFTAR